MNPERSILKLGHPSHEAVISAWLPMTVGGKEKRKNISGEGVKVLLKQIY